MSDFLFQHKNNYENIKFLKETNISKIYKAYNILEKRECVLKVINKKILELGDYDSLLEQLKREEEITKLCNSKNTVNFYQKIENDDNIIYELELCNCDLSEYIESNGCFKSNKSFFKKVILDLINALKTINKYGVIHRDIKPNNIFIKIIDGEEIIKLGDFGSSIFIKDNNFDQIGTFLYCAPEIIENNEYDENVIYGV